MPKRSPRAQDPLEPLAIGADRTVRLQNYGQVQRIVRWLNRNITANMTARISTVAFQGIEVVDVDVQVQIGGGLPAFTVVGLPDKAVAESRERVRAALGALGLALPPRRITVNLAPADLLKEGSHFDLPIALGLLVAMGVLPCRRARRLLGPWRARAWTVAWRRWRACCPPPSTPWRLSVA